MRSSALFWIYLVTIFLVVFIGLTQMDIQPGIIFYLMVAGQFLLVIMVYKVLTDTYETTKTFDDWYEDHPIDHDR